MKHVKKHKSMTYNEENIHQKKWAELVHMLKLAEGIEMLL